MRSKFWSGLRWAVAAAAAAAIAVALWRLEGAEAGLRVTPGWVGTVPVTVFAPKDAGPAPVVVIAHGFAGSQQLMLPFAVTLARNGYRAVTFDFPGHGRNPAPLRGGLRDAAARGATLQDAMDAVVRFARTLPGGEHLALLGHSMGAEAVVAYARAHPEVEATVAVSLFSPGVTAASPRNLLVIAGALEPAPIRDEGLRIVRMAAGEGARERETYGDFADGTARRWSLSGGVEHIGVLFSRQSMVEALGWMSAAFGARGDGWVDARAPWLGLLYLGLIGLAWPGSALLPRAVTPVGAAPGGVGPAGAGLGWRALLPLAVLPALLTPLVLWRLPTDFLPILLGDYLAAHYAAYGVLTAAGLWLAGRPVRLRAPAGPFVLASAVLAAYCIGAIGLPIDRYVTSFAVTPGRAPMMGAVLVGTLLFSVADEWLTRGAGARWGAYALTKACFVLSLVLAIALNPARLFFLAIIVPVIVLFLAVYGLLSTWAYRRTGQPLVGAVAVALAFAWAIAAVFPVVG